MTGPSPYDLVRLSDLGAAWHDDPDGAVQRLITAVSRTILSTINRPTILPRRYSETREVGATGVLLANWPVISVESVVRGSPTSFADGAHWSLEPADAAPPGRPQMLNFDWHAARGGPPANISYTAGYQVTDEPATAPSAAPFQLVATCPHGAWASDVRVSYAAGGTLMRVAGSPAPGQYAVDLSGTYTFSGADGGAALLFTYGYVPADLANAALDWIKDRLAYGDRIGMQSKSLGGQETVSYKIAAIPDFVQAALQAYTAVVPLC